MSAYVVRCADYASAHPTREAAERKLARILELGACQLDHSIDEEL